MTRIRRLLAISASQELKSKLLRGPEAVDEALLQPAVRAFGQSLHKDKQKDKKDYGSRHRSKPV